MRLVTCAAVLLTSLALAGSAAATLQRDPRLDAVASDVAGFSVTVYGEDDPAAWAQSPYPMALGYTTLGVPIVYLAPDVWTDLETVETEGLANDAGFHAARSVMTLIHEATHQRLHSADEGRVNACALAMFPDVIQRDFGVQPMATTTQTMTTYSWRKVRVRRRGRWLTVQQRITHTTTQTVTGPNPAYTILMVAAEGFYHAQPPPYSTGTCF